MSYWIALPAGNGYIIASAEQFGVRSNARRFADARGWKLALIVTDEQRRMIEIGEYDPDAENTETRAKKSKGK